jgi:hypothetical protein
MFENSATAYRLAEGVLSVPTEDEAILLTIGSGKYYGVRGAMRHLLEDLRQGLSLPQMISLTCERYDVEPGEATRDLERIVPRLIAAGILEPAEGVTGASPA